MLGDASVPGDSRRASSNELASPFPSALLTLAVKICCVFACPHRVPRIIVVGACLLFSVVKHGSYASEMFCDTLLLFSKWDFSKVLGLYQ